MTTAAPPVADTHSFGCPLCRTVTAVVSTKTRRAGRLIRRKRRCQNRHCGIVVTSVEILAAEYAELTGGGPGGSLMTPRPDSPRIAG